MADAIDIRDKDFLNGLIAGIDAEMAPLLARKAEIVRLQAALAAEDRELGKDLEAWRAGRASAQKARDLWFPPTD